MNKNVNLSPIRMIQIARDLRTEDLANAFGVTTVYIGAVKNYEKTFSMNTLSKGLNNLGIKLVDYFALVDFQRELLESDLQDQEKYTFMLIKTLGTITPSIKSEAEEFLSKHYTKHIKQSISEMNVQHLNNSFKERMQFLLDGYDELPIKEKKECLIKLQKGIFNEAALIEQFEAEIGDNSKKRK